jgi:hypothetical protein
MIIPGMNDVEQADLESMGVLVPEGVYLCKVEEAEEGTSDNQIPFIKFTFLITQPQEYAGKKLFDRVFFSQASLPFAKAKLAALSYDTSSAREFQPEQMRGRGVMLNVTHEQRFNKDGLPRTYATVTVWRKVGEGAPVPTVNQPANPDDDIPF